MSQSQKRIWARISWAIALALGAIGMYGAHQKGEQDQRREGELVRKTALLAQQRAEALSLHNQSIEALRESAGHGYAILDDQGRVKEWNQTLERWTGWSRQEMLGRRLDDLMDGSRGQKHRAGYGAMIRDPASAGRTFSIDCELRPRAAGKPPLWVRVNARVVALASGERYAVAFVDRARDVEEIAESERSENSENGEPSEEHGP